MPSEKAVQLVRESISESLSNKKKTMATLSLLNKTNDKSLDTATRCLKLAYISQNENGTIDYKTITEILFKEFWARFKKTPSVQSCLDGHFDDLVELFIPFCENTRLDELNKRINQTIQEDFYFDFPLRCEGHVEQEFEVVFYIQQTDVDPVDKIKKTFNLERKLHYKPKAKDKIPCPLCHTSEHITWGKGKINCSKCENDWQCELIDVWWCMGKPCGSPLRSLDWDPQPNNLTLNAMVHSNSKDYKIIAGIASWMNRLLFLFPRAFCNNCQRPLEPNYTLLSSNYQFYKTLHFYCDNSKCSMQGQDIYLNECWNPRCEHIIDSRVSNKRCQNGFYICRNCYGCCHDYLFQRTGSGKKGHKERNQMKCPHCGNLLMLSKFDIDSFWCLNCQRKLPIKDEHKMWWHWKDLQVRISEITPRRNVDGQIISNPEDYVPIITNVPTNLSENVWVRRRLGKNNFKTVELDDLRVGDFIFVKTKLIPVKIEKLIKKVAKKSNAHLVRKKTSKGFHQIWLEPPSPSRSKDD